MKALYDLKEILEDEIKQMTKKGDITPQELENAYKATDIIKDIETIKAMKEASEQGMYSQAYEYARDGGSYDGNYSQRRYSMDNSYNSYDNSYARRGRDGDGDGRYSERGSYNRDGYNSRDYSRHSEKEKMIGNLENMMNSAKSEKEREAIRQCIERLDN